MYKRLSFDCLQSAIHSLHIHLKWNKIFPPIFVYYSPVCLFFHFNFIVFQPTVYVVVYRYNVCYWRWRGVFHQFCFVDSALFLPSFTPLFSSHYFFLTAPLHFTLSLLILQRRIVTCLAGLFIIVMILFFFFLRLLCVFVDVSLLLNVVA